jgi:hypothetical protein
MAATYTLATLRTAILRKVDHETTGYFSAGWLNEEINNSAQKLHDLLIAVLGQGYALKEWVEATQAGVADYVLPADLYKPVAIQALTDIGWVPLQRYELQDRVIRTQAGEWPAWLPRYNPMGMSTLAKRVKLDPPPEVPYNIKLTYHVNPPVYAHDTDAIDIPWPEYLILDVAIKGQHKQRKDAAELIVERTNLRAEIESAHPPEDRANPPRVINARWRLAWPSALKHDAALISEVVPVYESAKIRASVAQAIASGGASPTAVEFDVPEFNNSTSMDILDTGAVALAVAETNAITLNRTGYYLVEWEAYWDISVGPKYTTPSFNGIPLEAPSRLQTVVGADLSHGKATLVKVTSVPMLVGLRAHQTDTVGSNPCNLRAALAVLRLGDL